VPLHADAAASWGLGRAPAEPSQTVVSHSAPAMKPRKTRSLEPFCIDRARKEWLRPASGHVCQPCPQTGTSGGSPQRGGAAGDAEAEGVERPEAERDGAEGAGARRGGGVAAGRNPASSDGRGRGLSSSDARRGWGRR
jgi:hypothetical protein